MVTSSFSFFFAAAAFAHVGGGSDGRGTEEGDTGPVSGMGSNNYSNDKTTTLYHNTA